jgi:hypothetical protein
MNEETLTFDRVTRKLLVIVIFCIGALTLGTLPLFRSLWLDETVTTWVISGDWIDAWHRALTFQAQSPLYFLIIKMWPFSGDFGLIVPALIFGALSGFGVYLTVKELLGKDAALFSILLLLTNLDLLKVSIQVRPYSLGLVGAAWSPLLLFWWLRYKEPPYLVLHFLLALIAFYSHYLFSLIAIGFPIILYFWGNQTFWRRYFIGASLTALLSLPGIYHLIWWSRKAGDSLFLPTPDFATFLKLILPLDTVVFLIFSTIVAALFTEKFIIVRSWKTLALALVWVVGGSLILFAASWLFGSSLYIDRYLSWRLSGVVLFSTLVLLLFRDQRGQRIFIAAYLFFAFQQTIGRKWFLEDWSTVAALARDSENIPVILYSGLRESEKLPDEESPELKEFLASPLIHYGVRLEQISVIPGFADSISATKYLQGVSAVSKKMAQSFLLVINDQPIFLKGQAVINPKTGLISFFEKEGAQCELFRSVGQQFEELVKVYRCDWRLDK